MITFILEVLDVNSKIYCLCERLSSQETCLLLAAAASIPNVNQGEFDFNLSFNFK